MEEGLGMKEMSRNIYRLWKMPLLCRQSSATVFPLHPRFFIFLPLRGNLFLTGGCPPPLPPGELRRSRGTGRNQLNQIIIQFVFRFADFNLLYDAHSQQGLQFPPPQPPPPTLSNLPRFLSRPCALLLFPGSLGGTNICEDAADEGGFGFSFRGCGRERQELSRSGGGAINNTDDIVVR